MNYRFIMFGNILETSQNSGRDGNLNFRHVLLSVIHIANSGTIPQVRFVSAVCGMLIFNVCYKRL